MPNALAQATSPYLLQHQDNPVDWQEWNEATLARARAEHKPILLSVGYAACHWCHVMAHESFEQPAIAGADEPALRQHQGRPRGAARPRRGLPAGAGGDGPAGRLAADHVPDPRRASRSGAAPTSRPSRATAGPASRRCWSRWPSSGRAAASGSRATARQSPQALQPPGGVGARRAAARRRWPRTVARALAERFDTVHGRPRRRAEVPAGADAAADLGDRAAHRRPRRCATASSTRSAASRRAASTIIWAAASPATRSTPTGWCRISRRCSTTTPSSSSCWAPPGPPRGEPLFARARRGDRRLAAARDDGRGRLRLGARRRQRGRGGPVLRLGRPRRSTACSAPDAPAFRLAYGVTESGNWEGSERPQPAARARPAGAGRGAAVWRDARQILLASRAEPDAAGPRRQGPGRLERPDDRGPGRRAAGQLRPPGLAGARPQRLRRRAART